jgi:serine/threonine protein kinase/tetratricopeptide (TPR) repeat protein
MWQDGWPAKGIDVDKVNHDLLVAVLAILTDAVPRPALAGALKAWTDGKGQTLAQWLKQSAGLDDQRIRALECLASAHLEAHQYDLRKSLDAWNALELTQGVLTEIHDDALRTTLGSALDINETVPFKGGSQEGPRSSIVNLPPRDNEGERYRLIRPHAQGGLGQVWIARDSELQRDVALKEIQPRYAEREDQRARFVLEAEITGNLEHPGIVPVYSLGRNVDGRPYYAMRFIRGESFAVAIRRFHKGRREPEGGVPSQPRPLLGIEFRQLIRRFLDVCDAMDYAHSRGVLHRDLKPANVMLGKYGETLVVDWGLAKVIGNNDTIPGRAEADADVEPSFAGPTVTASGDTQPGTTIGTPTYMSPEQARGDIDKLGPASDVYSLGATLYELLTGKVPFPEKTIAAVIEKVLKGDFPPPRALEPAIPPALEAICLKAMAAEPAQRYPCVRDLAQDMEHWLADEPVSAYPERRLERLGRWLRQHRTWTAAAVAALVGISVVATAAAVVVEQLRRQETETRKEAESNFKMAQTAVEDYLTSVSENTLLQEQNSVDIRGLRKELLKNALKYYERFVDERSNDPALREQLANAYFRVGEITQEIESQQRAIEAFRQAQTIWESLVQANPDNEELSVRLAQCDLAIGKQQRMLGDLHAAMASFVPARAILEKLTSRKPEQEIYQASLADCYSWIGITQGQLESGDSGLEILEKARKIQQTLIGRSPTDKVYKKRLAEIINALGFVHSRREDYKAAFGLFEEVQRICQPLLLEIGEGPKPVRLLDLMALAEYNMAIIHELNKRFDKAMESFEKSLEYRAALVAAHPSVTEFQENLGKSYCEVALGQHTAGHDEKAFATLSKSFAILKKLVDSEPGQARYHGELGRSWNALGYLHDELRENEEAIPAFEKAVAELRVAIARSPDDNSYKAFLSLYLENLGEQYVDLGRVDAGLPYYVEARDLRRQLYASHPEKQEYSQGLGNALMVLGVLYRHTGDSTAAHETLVEARPVMESRAIEAPGDPARQVQLAIALTREAESLADLKQTDAALELLDKAVTIWSKLGAISASPGHVRAGLSESLWERARLFRTLGKSTDADKLDEEREAVWKGRAPGELVALVGEELNRVTLIGYGKTTVGALGGSVRQLDLDQAAANLRLAIALGYSDLGRLRSDPRYAILLARDDLKPLIKALETRDRPAQTGPSQ